MNLLANGFAVWCTPDGSIAEVIAADADSPFGLVPGEPLASLATDESRPHLETFLHRAVDRRTVFHHVALIRLPSDRHPQTLHLMAHTREARIFVAGAFTPSALVLTYIAAADLPESGLPTYLSLVEKGVETAAASTGDDALLQQFSVLNNELVNAQRELWEKNRDLQESIRKNREMHERLLDAERNRAVVETAGAAAHGINQPLSVIVGLSQLRLMGTEVTGALRSDLQDIYEAGRQVDAIVKRMLAVRKHISKPYIGNIRILDMDASDPDAGTAAAPTKP